MGYEKIKFRPIRSQNWLINLNEEEMNHKSPYKVNKY